MATQFMPPGGLPEGTPVGPDGDTLGSFLKKTDLNSAMASVFQALPTADPRDGKSLWNNGGILTLSVKAS